MKHVFTVLEREGRRRERGTERGTEGEREKEFKLEGIL